jgi:hypothetical protein
LQYQLVYQDCKSNKALSDGLLADNFMISRKQVDLRKITANVKGKEKIEFVDPAIHGRYFK